MQEAGLLIPSPTDEPGRATVVRARLCAVRSHEARREVERRRRGQSHDGKRASETTAPPGGAVTLEGADAPDRAALELGQAA